MYVCNESIIVSSYRCRMLMSNVQPVAMHNVVFYYYLWFVMFVADAIDNFIVKSYSSIGLVTALYAECVCCMRVYDRR